MPTPADKKEEAFRKDPIGSIKTDWNELMVENEKQKKDFSHGFKMTPEIGMLIIIFLGVLIVSLCIQLIDVYLKVLGCIRIYSKIS